MSTQKSYKCCGLLLLIEDVFCQPTSSQLCGKQSTNQLKTSTLIVIICKT